jgi:hypothetical protein
MFFGGLVHNPLVESVPASQGANVPATDERVTVLDPADIVASGQENASPTALNVTSSAPAASAAAAGP